MSERHLRVKICSVSMLISEWNIPSRKKKFLLRLLECINQFVLRYWKHYLCSIHFFPHNSQTIRSGSRVKRDLCIPNALNVS